MIKRGLVFNSRFELTQPLGRGAFGTVWEALDLTTGTLVAVKLVSQVLLSVVVRGFGHFQAGKARTRSYQLAAREQRYFASCLNPQD